MNAAQTEFKDLVTDALDERLKDFMAVVKQQVQNLCE
jgi:hypothetical protein